MKSFAAKIVKVMLGLAAAVLMITLAGPVDVQAQNIEEVFQNPDMDALQLSSSGHIINFRSTGLELSNGVYVYQVDFGGTAGVVPENLAADGDIETDELFSLEQVSYSNLWPGITLSYDAPEGGILRSTYYLEPYADADLIRLNYNAPLEVLADGRLAVQYESGMIYESAPIAWQVVEGQRQPVTTAFILSGNESLGFRLGEYDHALPLFIDPSIEWHTFLGSTDSEKAESMVIDSSGNLYVSGFAKAGWSGTPVRAHRGDGMNDTFVAKLNSSGNLQWHTFLGTTGHDYGRGLTIYGSLLYVTGNSQYNWGSPVRPHQNSGTNNNIFVAGLDTGSGALLWNTFLGGTGPDESDRLSGADANGVVIAGFSPSSWGSPVRAFSGGSSDIFAARVDSSGNLIWNTFLGGSEADRGYGSLLANGAAYIMGYSAGTWGEPVRDFAGGMYDGVVAKLNASNGALIWNTFLGGSGADTTTIALLDGSSLYVSGNSVASWGTSPVRAYSDGYDTFAANLDPATGSLKWHTFLGGSGYDPSAGMALSNGILYVSGSGFETWGSTPNPGFSGGSDFSLALLDPNSGILRSNGFYGGPGYDEIGRNAIVTRGDNVYLAGSTGEGWGSPLSGHSGSDDVLVIGLKLDEADLNEAPVITSNGGGATASISVEENGTSVTTVSASDVDAGTTLTYSISGGTDSSKFSINSSSGILTFGSAPDYENPGDSNGDNRYQVAVNASDGSLSDTQTITVTVTNVKEDSVTSITADAPDPSVMGQSYPVTVDVAPDAGGGTPTGSVTVSDGSASCTITLPATFCNLTSTTIGAKTLTATYSGDSNWNGSSDTESHTVQKADTAVTITDVSPSPSVTGEPITVSLTVTSTAGTPTGMVIVSYGSGLPAGSCMAYLTGGVGSCTLTIATAGSKTLSAEYQGDTSFSSSATSTAHTVQKADSSVAISSVSPETTLTGQPYTVSVTAAAVSPGAGTPTGTVSVADGEGNTCSITLSGGVGSCELATYTIGSKTITADYSGDGDFNGSDTSQSHPVTIAEAKTTIIADDPDPSGFEEQITLEASVVPVSPAGGIPEGTVQFFEDTTFLCSGVLSSGTTQCTYDDLSVGSHNLTAVYSGETSTYLGSTSAEETHLVQSIQLDDNKTSTSFTNVGKFNVEGGGAPFTFSLKAVGRFCNATNGAGNGYFGISDSTLQRKSDTPAGTYLICVESQDKDGGTVQEEFEIIINNPPALDDLSLDHKTVGVIQTVVGTLTLTDGQDPQVVSLESAGGACTAENSSGNDLFRLDGLVLERKADTPVGEYPVCIQVKDAEGEIAQWSYTITVTNPPNALTLDHKTVSTQQTEVGEFSLSDGQKPYQYTLENSGEVCDPGNSAGNDRFEMDGAILKRKSDTAVGTYAICAAVEDANGLTTQGHFTITVTAPPSNLTLSNTEVSTVEEIVGTLQTTAGQYLYEYSLENNGDVCTVVNGADNDLFEVEGNALKRKANTSAGFYAVCLQTRDANGEVFQKAFSVTVSYKPASSELWSIGLTSDLIVDGEGPGTLAGSMISTLHGTTFSLVDTDLFPLAAKFNISPDGKLTLNTTANYALHQYYPLRLAGTSPDGETKTLDVVIQVMKNGTSAGAQAVPDKASVFVTKQIRIDVLSNDILSEGATEWVEHQIVRYPVLGEAEIGSIIYSASKILTGMDTLTYRACDDLGFCVTGEVEIAIESISGIPATGFPQGIESGLPAQPEEQVYSAEQGLSIEIPKLSIDAPILGIPLEEEGWDLTWLGNQVGWLNGSAYPTWDGNAILTGHLYNAWGRPGIFHDLADLMWGDRVLIRMDGQTYTFEVREILENVAADDVETLTVHREEPWLSLVTCQDYDEESGTYSGRLIVRAALVKVE